MELQEEPRGLDTLESVLYAMQKPLWSKYIPVCIQPYVRGVLLRLLAMAVVTALGVGIG